MLWLFRPASQWVHRSFPHHRWVAGLPMACHDARTACYHRPRGVHGRYLSASATALSIYGSDFSASPSAAAAAFVVVLLGGGEHDGGTFHVGGEHEHAVERGGRRQEAHRLQHRGEQRGLQHRGEQRGHLRVGGLRAAHRQAVHGRWGTAAHRGGDAEARGGAQA